MKTLKGVYNTATGKYEEVDVSDEVYTAYTRSGWNIDDNNSSFYRHEIQISSLMGSENSNHENFHELISAERHTEYLAERRLWIEQIKNAIMLLSPDEQMLIRALFFEGMSEREYAKCLGIPQRTINNRKFRLISKLKKIADL